MGRPTTQTIHEQLAELIGHEHVLPQSDAAVASPANTAEVSGILRCANEQRVAVTPRGAGTKRCWGNPVQASVALDMARMNAVLEHTWQDMTCTVEAGCRWSAMQTQLAEHGQFVALDPLWPDNATVGGVVATNDSGALRHRYGSLRDLIIGMTIVLADGTVAHSGGKVVKNVAGYDLHKLMTGAYGTLGVTTEVTFRLHAIPRSTRSLTVPSREAAPLGKLLHALLDSQLSTQAMQVRSEGSGFALDVELAAMQEVLDQQTGRIAALAASAGLSAVTVEPDVWQARQRLFDATEAYIVKATMLPSEIAGFADAVRQAGGQCAIQAVGTGIATIPMAQTAPLLDLRRHLEAGRGSLTILVAPPDGKLDRWGTAPDTLPLMRAIKERFDPNRVLNPGRFLGGI